MNLILLPDPTPEERQKIWLRVLTKMGATKVVRNKREALNRLASVKAIREANPDLNWKTIRDLAIQEECQRMRAVIFYRRMCKAMNWKVRKELQGPS